MPDDRTYRIVSGDPASVEAEVNRISEDYGPIVWNIQSGPDGPLVTCILVSAKEMRKAALMQARMMAPGRPM